MMQQFTPLVWELPRLAVIHLSPLVVRLVLTPGLSCLHVKVYYLRLQMTSENVDNLLDARCWQYL